MIISVVFSLFTLAGWSEAGWTLFRYNPNCFIIRIMLFISIRKERGLHQNIVNLKPTTVKRSIDLFTNMYRPLS